MTHSSKVLGLVLLGAALVTTGCNTLAGQPAIKQAAINPAELKPGDSAVITVAIKDRHSIIDRVEGVVLENPQITFRLHDTGETPDEKAGDGIWTMQVDVPLQAPTGTFTLEFTAYRSDGLPVPIRDKEGNVTQLKQDLPVIIRTAQP